MVRATAAFAIMKDLLCYSMQQMTLLALPRSLLLSCPHQTFAMLGAAKHAAMATLSTLNRFFEFLYHTC
jgi:hypothetical protein